MPDLGPPWPLPAPAPPLMEVLDYNIHGGPHCRIRIGSDIMKATFTGERFFVSNWISFMDYHFGNRNLLDSNPTPVGLAVEYGTLGLSTLQLFMDSDCLVIELSGVRDDIPKELLDFLINPAFIFYGYQTGILRNDLRANYGIQVHNIYDIRNVAAHQMQNPALRDADLRTLAELTSVAYADNPLTPRDWDSLTRENVLYAVADAWLYHQVGEQLSQYGPIF